MRRLSAIAWVILLALLVWYTAFHAAPRIEQDILSRSISAVKPLAGAIETVAGGRSVALRGAIPSEDAKAKMLAAARSVYGALEPIDQLIVTAVAEAGSAAAAPEPLSALPARLSVVKSPDGSISASGDIPSEDARVKLMEMFTRGDAQSRILDRLTVRAGGLPEDWTPRALAGTRELAKLDWGSLLLQGTKSYLSGMADSDGIGAMGDALGAAFTVELSPRPADLRKNRVAALVGGTSTNAGAAANTRAATDERLARAEADAETARLRIAELEASQAKIQSDLAARDATATQSKLELDAAKARIAVLTQQLAAIPGQPPPQAEPQSPTGQPPSPEMAAAQAPAQPATPPKSTHPVSTQIEAVAACNHAIGALLKTASISFESGEARITRQGNDVLDRIVNVAQPCIGDPGLRVTVGGHTDGRGREADNLSLSQARADAVKEALIFRSVLPEAVNAIGYGEAQPIANDRTFAGRQRNRRITIDWSLR